MKAAYRRPRGSQRPTAGPEGGHQTGGGWLLIGHTHSKQASHPTTAGHAARAPVSPVQRGVPGPRSGRPEPQWMRRLSKRMAEPGCSLWSTTVQGRGSPSTDMGTNPPALPLADGAPTFRHMMQDHSSWPTGIGARPHRPKVGAWTGRAARRDAGAAGRARSTGRTPAWPSRGAGRAGWARAARAAGRGAPSGSRRGRAAGGRPSGRAAGGSGATRAQRRFGGGPWANLMNAECGQILSWRTWGADNDKGAPCREEGLTIPMMPIHPLAQAGRQPVLCAGWAGCRRPRTGASPR